MTRPKLGATNWTEDGIEPAKAYLGEADALLEALSDRTDDPEMLKIIVQLGNCLRGIRGAIYELELFGIETKRNRTHNG